MSSSVLFVNQLAIPELLRILKNMPHPTLPFSAAQTVSTKKAPLHFFPDAPWRKTARVVF